ncbi:MAG: NAD(P)-dependent oxidoreductase [Magnetococcales bacterium]|nr:NAD(P)-dependent oxidoreductase [Magnetococcales bacterium]
MKRVLILGHTGKMGTAFCSAYAHDHEIVTANSADFDAADLGQVSEIVEHAMPDVIINCIAYMGVDACELDPARAFAVNTLFPKYLAEVSGRKGCQLVHLSTDAVFPDTAEGRCYTEDSFPHPINIYGLTKLEAEHMIQANSCQYYIFRLSVLFGPAVKNNQFVEKMLDKARIGHDVLKIADDIICTPSYSYDVANCVRTMTDTKAPFGLYHLVNQGQSSLYGLVKEMIDCLGWTVVIEPASYRDFPHTGNKNICVPIVSSKIPPLRCWREAAKEYCQQYGLPRRDL